MADSAIPITGGSGYNVDTRTESTNSNHRQVITIGDPSSNGGVAPVDATNGLSVTLTTAIPAGTAAIGKLAANDGVDIGDVTINNAVGNGVYIRPGTGVNLDTANVTVATSALPSGAATASAQTTGNASLSNIETSVGLIDDAVYTDGTGTPSKALAVAGTDGTNPQIISTNSTGHVNIADGGNTITVDGTVAATQSGTWNITNVSGTVSLPTGAATSAKQDTIITSVQLIDDVVYTDATGTPSAGIAVMGTDGTNPQLISVTSAGLVNIADGGGNISIDDGGNTITVDGIVTANLGTIGGAATAAKQPALGTAGTASTDVITVQGIASMTALKVDGSGVTQPISGTVTANAGTGFAPIITDGSAAGTTGIHILGTDGTNGQILSTNASGHVNIADGGNSITVDGTVTVNALPTGTNTIGSVKLTDGTDVADVLDLTNSNPLAVALVDGSGDQLTSIGGGVQYTEGDIDTTITGTAMLWEDASDTLRTVSAAKPLPVDIQDSTIAVTQSGTWDEVGINDSGNSITVDDGGSSLTVDGTVGVSGTVTVDSELTTADLDTGAGTDTRAVVGLVLAASGGGLLVGSANPLPISDNSGSITVDNGGTFATQATLQTGNNVVGQVKLTDGTTVADVLDLTNHNPLTVAIVDTNGDQISSFGGGTQYTEDAVAAANPVGTALNLIRADALAGLTTADGDNVAARGTDKGELYVKHVDAIPITDNSGSLTVDGSVSITGTVAVTQSGTWDEVGINDSGNSITVDNGGTFAVQVDGSALTSLQLIDDVVATLGTTTYTEAATKGAVIGAVRRDADTTLVDTTNEVGPLQMDANGRLKVEVFSGETLPVSLTSTTVTGTVAVTQSGTWDEVGINDSGNSITVDNGGTFAVQAAQSGTWTLGANSGVDIGDVTLNNLTTTPVFTQHNITGIGHGVTTVTTAGTDVALAASTACKKVIIQAQTDNTTGVAVGATGVDATVATGTGIFLYPGDSIELEIDNLADVFVDSLTNGEGVRYTYFT